MRVDEMLRVGVVAAACLAGAGSATSGRSTEECRPGQVCGFQPVPPYTRRHVVGTETAVDGIDIAVKQQAATSWSVLVRNASDSTIRVLWDESSFVASNSESMGRLIRGETRKIDVEKAQPPTPVAPGATLSQFVLVEKFISAENFEADITKGDVDARRLDLTKLQALRDARDKAIVGGKIYVVVEMGDEKRTWVGRVSDGDGQ